MGEVQSVEEWLWNTTHIFKYIGDISVCTELEMLLSCKVDRFLAI